MGNCSSKTMCDVPDFVHDLGTHCMFTTKEGVELHVVVKGEPTSKPTILFLHGYPDCWLTWKKQIPFFADKGYRCAALSLRGYVNSAKPEGVENYAIPKLVADAKETIEFLGGQPVILIGHDWGGVIAFFLAVQNPNLVVKLVLFNTSFGKNFIKSLDKILNSPMKYYMTLPNVMEVSLKIFDYALLESTFKSLLKNKTITKEEMELRKSYCDIPGALTSMTNYYRALITFADENKQLEVAMNVPLKIVWGENDDFFKIDTLDGLEEEIDDVTVAKLPNIGHFPHLEAPDEVNEEILKFISSTPESRF